MTENERQSIIVQLEIVKGWNKSAFDKMTDKELEQEMKRLYG